MTRAAAFAEISAQLKDPNPVLAVIIDGVWNIADANHQPMQIALPRNSPALEYEVTLYHAGGVWTTGTPTGAVTASVTVIYTPWPGMRLTMPFATDVPVGP
jgi:hypothetical protein